MGDVEQEPEHSDGESRDQEGDPRTAAVVAGADQVHDDEPEKWIQRHVGELPEGGGRVGRGPADHRSHHKASKPYRAGLPR